MNTNNIPDRDALKVIEELNSDTNETIITITHKDKVILSFPVRQDSFTSEFTLLLDELSHIYRLGVVDGVGCLHNLILCPTLEKDKIMNVDQEGFLKALTELSNQFGIGITKPDLFVMPFGGAECDSGRVYRADSDGNIDFV